MKKKIERKIKLSTIKWMIGYLGKHKPIFAIALICPMVSAYCLAMGTYLIRPVINDYFIPAIDSGVLDIKGIVQTLSIMALFFLASAILLFLQNTMMTRLCHYSLAAMREDMFVHMQNLPLSFFDRNNSGTVMSKYSNDIDVISTMLRGSLPQMLYGVVTIITILVTMLLMNLVITMVVLLCTIVLTLVLKQILKRNAILYARQLGENSDLQGYAGEMIEGQEIVRYFGREDDVTKKFDEKNEKLFQTMSDTNSHTNRIFPVSGGIFNIGYAVIAMTGCILAFMGKTDIGAVAAFLPYFRSFTTPIIQISRQFDNVLAAMAGAERIYAFLNETPEADEGLENVQIDEMFREGVRIRFDQVDFGYHENQTVLEKMDFDIPPKTCVAVVGASGAGKTTIMVLLNRLYEIRSGRILFNGHDIRKYKKSELRKLVSVVYQDTHFFSGTIADNIRIGCPDATDDDVEKAARLSNAHSFISHLPDGYKTMMTDDGRGFSDGQKQLISIARAAITNAPVLVLDEATSFVDSNTEAAIRDGIKNLMKGKTTFIVAHKLSTVENVDLILFLKDGRIAESGTHEQLIEKRGLYYELYHFI